MTTRFISIANKNIWDQHHTKVYRPTEIKSTAFLAFLIPRTHLWVTDDIHEFDTNIADAATTELWTYVTVHFRLEHSYDAMYEQCVSYTVCFQRILLSITDVQRVLKTLQLPPTHTSGLETQVANQNPKQTWFTSDQYDVNTD